MAIFSAEVNFTDDFPTRFYVNDYLYENISTLFPKTITFTDTGDLISQISEFLGDDSRWRDMLVYHSLGLPSSVKAILKALFGANVKATNQNISFSYDSVQYNCYPMDVRYFTYYGNSNVLSIFSQYSANSGFIFPLWSSSMLSEGTTIIGSAPRSFNITIINSNTIRLESQYRLTYGNGLTYPYTIIQGDPYAPGGIAEPGGGDGTFDWESDPVPVQPLPEISITGAGFVNLYVPTKAQLQNLCRYLWSSAFDIDSLKRIFLEPMDVILGLSILPVTPEEVEADMGTILVGQYSSGISAYVAHRQYVQVDCGTISIEPKWGAYLDFSPYSKLQMYLPYIGFVDITPDDCMNGTIHVVYNLDILSGSCLAQVECTTPGKDGESNSHVLYEYTGNCAVDCPVTSGQYRNIISSIFNIASGAVESTATKSLAPVVTSISDAIKGTTKPAVSRAGGPGKNTGILGHQAPFLVLTCPRMIIPGQQNAMIGYPSYVTLNLGDLNGYTQIDTIHLFGVPASKDEQDEIVDLLQKGVFM